MSKVVGSDYITVTTLLFIKRFKMAKTAADVLIEALSAWGVEVIQECDTLLIIGSAFPYIEFHPKPG